MLSLMILIPALSSIAWIAFTTTCATETITVMRCFTNADLNFVHTQYHVPCARRCIMSLRLCDVYGIAGGCWLSIRMRPELSMLTNLTSLQLHDTVNALQYAPPSLKHVTLLGRVCCASTFPSYLSRLTNLQTMTLHDCQTGASLASFLGAVQSTCTALNSLALQAVQLGASALGQGTLMGPDEWNAVAEMSSLQRLEVSTHVRLLL